MQQWKQQAEKQRDAFQKLAQGVGSTQLMENYSSLFRTGFSTYQEALDAAEKATQKGLEDFEKATEAFEKAAQQFPMTPHKPTSH